MPTNVNEWQKEHPWEPSPSSHPQPVPLVKTSDLFNPMLTIADVMCREGPTCPPDAHLSDVVRILRDSACSAVFVVADGRPVGVVTDRAVALAVGAQADPIAKRPVRDLMCREVSAVRMDAKLDVLLDRFADEGVAVVDGEGRLQGIVRWLELIGPLSERALGNLVIHLYCKNRP